MVHARWRCLLISMQLVSAGFAAESTSVRIERVEAGLRPAIVLDGRSAETHRLIDRLRFYKTPGVSIAVIDQGEIAWCRGYGVLEAGTERPVTTDTLFQAASISKPVAALVALRLVERGVLDLDEDINRKLHTWKLPENEFTTDTKVSLRLLLSHRAGLTDRAGFQPATANQSLPSLREILETGNWTPAPIRVGLKPGSGFAYSGGGYCLVEQLLEDVSKKPFHILAHELALDPLRMASSSFDQHLSPDRTDRTAVGHQFNGKKLSQNWNLYPATSAAGLWTTPSDLARFAIDLQGNENGVVLSRALINEMLSIQGAQSGRDSKVIAVREGFDEQPPASWGLGVGLIGRPPTRFFHTGSNPGYQSELQMYLRGGRGAVVMTNGDQGWRLAREILSAIAQEYEWPDYGYHPEVRKVAQLTREEKKRFVGRYRISFLRPSSLALNIKLDGDDLTAQIVPYAQKVLLYPESKDSCFAIEDATKFQFSEDEGGVFRKVVSDLGWSAQRIADKDP